MGVFCSCFGESQHQDHDESAGDTQRSSNNVLQNVVNKCKSMFHKGQVQAAATGNEEGTAATIITTAPDTIGMQREVQAGQQSSLARKGNSTRSSRPGQNLNKAAAQTGNNVARRRKRKIRQGSKPAAKEAGDGQVKKVADLSSEDYEGSAERLWSTDEEDVCPTCLEEYDEGNPKITTQCNHHYHLSCIYEWMERSASCPVCGKLMVFEQMS